MAPFAMATKRSVPSAPASVRNVSSVGVGVAGCETLMRGIMAGLLLACGARAGRKGELICVRGGRKGGMEAIKKVVCFDILTSWRIARLCVCVTTGERGGEKEVKGREKGVIDLRGDLSPSVSILLLIISLRVIRVHVL